MRIPSGAGTTPQPDDMRIIDALKIIYKKVYLTELLNLFDVDRGHEQGCVAMTGLRNWQPQKRR